MIQIKNPNNFKMVRHSPDCIYGTKEQLAELGMRVLGKPSQDSVMWTHECVDVEIPTTPLNGSLNNDDGEEYCDVFFHNGVVFGYEAVEDWIQL